MPGNPALHRVRLCQERLSEAYDRYLVLVSTLCDTLLNSDGDNLPILIEEEKRARELIVQRAQLLQGFQKLLTETHPDVRAEEDRLNKKRTRVVSALKSASSALQVQKEIIKKQMDSINIPQRVRKTSIERVIPERIDITL